MIMKVARMDEEELKIELDKLVREEVVYKRGIPPEATFSFKHVLLRDVAYQSMVQTTRQLYHQRIADEMERSFPALAEREPEILAHHYQVGGLFEKAVRYWQSAGKRAIERSALAEAIAHFSDGLKVLSTAEGIPSRRKQELSLQSLLGSVYIGAKGLWAPEVERAFRRAVELCDELGLMVRKIPMISGLWGYHIYHAEFASALELSKKSLEIAEKIGDPFLLLQAHQIMGITLFTAGSFEGARSHLEKAASYYDPRIRFFSAAQDPILFVLSVLCVALQVLGYPDQAITRDEEARSLAGRLENPFNLVLAMQWSGNLHWLRAELQEAMECWDVSFLHATRRELLPIFAEGLVLKACAEVKETGSQEAFNSMERSVSAVMDSGIGFRRTTVTGLVAEAYLHLKKIPEGLRAVEEGLQFAEKTLMRENVAGLHRLKGELLELQGNRDAEAEACFREAISTAQSQHAKFLELKAVISLGRLLKKQKKTDEARQLLSEIYSWFSEGFDTPDLKEAKAFLEGLG
jgi:tetratricopeptide (TPR) repeat protein